MTNILTPVGRLVMGSAWDPITADRQGNPLLIKNGPNAGQPRSVYLLGLAIPKTDPGVNELLDTIHAVAREAFPKLHDTSGRCTLPTFAFKYIDGDSTTPNEEGNIPCNREGFPGHWVFRFSSGIAPTVWKRNETGKLVQLTEPDQFKCGYYCQISGNIVSNNSTQKPGVYLNYYSSASVIMIGYGEEIISGPTAEEAFANAATQLPPGASATPIAPKTEIASPATQNTAPPPATQAAPPPPAPGFTEPERKYKYNGAEYTRDQLLQSGWTHKQIDDLDEIPF